MSDDLRIGIIGFDTGHVSIFSRMLHDREDPFYVPGGKVVAGYPSFSPDIEESYSRVEGFKQELVNKWGVKLVFSIEELLDQVDFVLLESVDGRRHLNEARPVIAAGKPLFIDKPFTVNYAEAVEISRLAHQNKVPLFSSSSLRYDVNLIARKRELQTEPVFACDAYGICLLEPTHPGLFWYGIHAVEILYTFMDIGCQRVYTQLTDPYHFVMGTWSDGRFGTVRGIHRGGDGYGATVFAEKHICQFQASRDVPYYSQLLKQIIHFFQGASAPVPLEETLEIIRFMQAAWISETEGREVALDEITSLEID